MFIDFSFVCLCDAQRGRTHPGFCALLHPVATSLLLGLIFDDFLAAGNILVDERFLSGAVEGDERPAASRPVDRGLLRYLRIGARQVAEIKKRFHHCAMAF
jgi:hypothetical protein